jgi:hypothetical protein
MECVYVVLIITIDLLLLQITIICLRAQYHSCLANTQKCWKVFVEWMNEKNMQLCLDYSFIGTVETNTFP